MSEIINVGFVASGVRSFYGDYPARIDPAQLGGRGVRGSVTPLTPSESPPASTLRTAYLNSIRAQIDSGDFESLVKLLVALASHRKPLASVDVELRKKLEQLFRRRGPML